MKDSAVVTLRQPGEFADPLTEVLRGGARASFSLMPSRRRSPKLSPPIPISPRTTAISAWCGTAICEANVYSLSGACLAAISKHRDKRSLIRTIQTGIGPVAVQQPRVRDRGATGAERIRFSSAILPPYARRYQEPRCAVAGAVSARHFDRERSLVELTKRSLSDMQEALAALLGKDAPNLSPAVLTRLKAGWQDGFCLPRSASIAA